MLERPLDGATRKDLEEKSQSTAWQIIQKFLLIKCGHLV